MLDLPTTQSDGEASVRRQSVRRQSHDDQGPTNMFDPSEGYNELKRREFNDEQDKKELGFDDWSSSPTTAAADSYPGLSMQDKKNFALLVTLCKYEQSNEHYEKKNQCSGWIGFLCYVT